MEPGLKVRACEPGEEDAVLQLWQDAGSTPSISDSPDSIRRALGCSSAALLLAEVDGQVVGSILAGFDGWRASLYRLAVHPGHRRRGVALALVNAAEERLRAMGAPRVAALVEVQRPEALAFWEAAGYAHDRRLRRYIRTLGREE